MQKLIDFIKDKKVLFITTKNIDYIRNSQELRIINESAQSVDVLYSKKKNNLLRIPDVWIRLNRERVKKCDVVFVGFEPQFVIPFVGNKIKGKILVIDFFISVYDTLICDRKQFRDNGIVSKLCLWLDKRTIREANHIITDTKAHAAFFIDKFNINSNLFETIYLEADPLIYYPRKQNKLEKLKNKFVILYFGSILPLQGVEIVLEAVELLKDRNDIFFDIIGPIPQKYHKPISENVFYTEWLSQTELAEHIANADLCLAGHFCCTIEKAKRTIPGKAYIYEMMDKTMVLGDNSANRELFVEDEKHIFVEMGNGVELSNKIVDVINYE